MLYAYIYGLILHINPSVEYQYFIEKRFFHNLHRISEKGSTLFVYY